MVVASALFAYYAVDTIYRTSEHSDAQFHEAVRKATFRLKGTQDASAGPPAALVEVR